MTAQYRRTKEEQDLVREKIVRLWNDDTERALTPPRLAERFRASTHYVLNCLNEAIADGRTTRPVREPSTKVSRTGRA